MRDRLGKPEIQLVNYRTHKDWHEKVLELTGGIGVDLVVENGGSSSLVQSMLCTRRGGTVSQVGYLGGSKPEEMKEFVSTIIDRRLNVRYESRYCSEQLVRLLIRLCMLTSDLGASMLDQRRTRTI